MTRLDFFEENFYNESSFINSSACLTTMQYSSVAGCIDALCLLFIQPASLNEDSLGTDDAHRTLNSNTRLVKSGKSPEFD